MYLKEHPDVRAQLEAKLLPMLGLKPTATPAAEPAKPPAGETKTPVAPPRPAGTPSRPPALVGNGDRKK
jgi:hypothetical protein